MKRTADSKSPQKQTRNRSQRESGQIVIFMAFLLVFLVGMAGLAIDGGRLYFEYRDVQNATDAAIQAATYAVCTERDIIPAAFDAVEDNGVDIDDGVTVWVFNPPITGDKEGDDEYVEVVVTSTIDPYFIQVVYDADLTVSARAVGRCIPGAGGDGAFEGALFTNSDSCQYTVNWNGSDNTVIGDVHTNYNNYVSGQNNQVVGHLTMVGPEQGSHSLTYTPAGESPVTVVPQPFPNYFDIADYRPDAGTHGGYHPYPESVPFGRIAREARDHEDPPGTPVNMYFPYTCSDEGDKMDNGWLESSPFGQLLNPSTGELRDGIYYSPCNIDLSNSDLHGNVTFVAEGEISIQGSNHTMQPSIYSPALLAFSNKQHPPSDVCSKDAIYMSGSTQQWHGIVYAPYGRVKMAGSNLNLIGGVFSDNVELNGQHITIEWDGTLMPARPPSIGIAE